MKIKNETLKEIEELAAVFFTVEDIALVLQIEAKQLKDELKKEKSKVHEHYWRGRLRADFLVRQNIFELAKRGSSQAQDTVMKLNKKLKMHEAT